MPDSDNKARVPDWWRDQEATDAVADAARETQFEEELDAHISDIHEWLDERYRTRYKPGQSETCLEALLICQTERVPASTWLVEAIEKEIELALRRPIAWEQIKVAAQKANEERKRVAQEHRDWCWQEGKAILEINPTLCSEDRLASLISKRAKGTEHEAAPRTIRRHIQGILAKRSKHGQTE